MHDADGFERVGGCREDTQVTERGGGYSFRQDSNSLQNERLCIVPAEPVTGSPPRPQREHRVDHGGTGRGVHSARLLTFRL